MAMRSILIAGPLAALFALSVPAAAEGPTGEQKLAQLVGSRTASAQKRCIAMNRVGGPYIIDQTAIAYRSGPDIYVNRPENANVLHLNDLLINSRADLCEGDQVQIFTSSYGALRGIIKMNEFVRYTPTKKVRSTD